MNQIASFWVKNWPIFYYFHTLFLGHIHILAHRLESNHQFEMLGHSWDPDSMWSHRPFHIHSKLRLHHILMVGIPRHTKNGP